ncbi:MAG: tyrosine-type recombinase/integrase [Cyanobacteria bacterium RUI128]|nr:tyrosine-type recombinase/integrase [Cyanobacteria bacterium RUI128]
MPLPVVILLVPLYSVIFADSPDFEEDLTVSLYSDQITTSLRHTYATYLLSNNIPVKYVQEQLGHTSAQTTLNVYTHVLKSTNQQAINLLEKLKYEQNVSKAENLALKKPTNSELLNGGG